MEKGPAKALGQILLQGGIQKWAMKRPSFYGVGHERRGSHVKNHSSLNLVPNRQGHKKTLSQKTNQVKSKERGPGAQVKKKKKRGLKKKQIRWTGGGRFFIQSRRRKKKKSSQKHGGGGGGGGRKRVGHACESLYKGS